MVSILEQLRDLFVFAHVKKCELSFAMPRNGERENTVVLSGKLHKQFETWSIALIRPTREERKTPTIRVITGRNIFNSRKADFSPPQDLGGIAYDKC